MSALKLLTRWGNIGCQIGKAVHFSLEFYDFYLIVNMLHQEDEKDCQVGFAGKKR